MDKQHDTITVTSPDNKLVLEGKALHHNPGSWLFYVNVSLGKNTNIQNNTIQTPVSECTYAILAEDEAERRALLPIAGGYDSVYALLTGNNPKTQLAQLKLWHERLGHPHFAKVASILGVPAPSPPPACLTCLAAKSKRRPLTGSSGIYEGIRPGYAWAWDYV